MMSACLLYDESFWKLLDAASQSDEDIFESIQTAICVSLYTTRWIVEISTSH